jgi:hypothetical protein
VAFTRFLAGFGAFLVERGDLLTFCSTSAMSSLGEHFKAAASENSIVRVRWCWPSSSMLT